MRDDLKIVFVGHVDHGKSTLIGRLLYETESLPDGVMEEVRKTSEKLGRDVEYAYVLDNLREEREQGITIDTTQVFFKSDERDYVIIDAPGHVEFVKNMITGASQAEAAILIVDAAEGVKEQTRRHAYILGMLGLKQVVVAVNKMDAVGRSQERFEAVKKELMGFLGGLHIEPAYIIPLSAKEGDNVVHRSEKMAWYGGLSLLEALDRLKPSVKNLQRPFTYPVQDVYMVGDKRIFAGRVEAGTVRVGDDVTVLPNLRRSKVKSIEVFMRDDVSRAEAGESVGITLEDKLFVERGQVICGSWLPKVTDRVPCRIFWMSPEPLREGEALAVRVATQEAACRVELTARMDSSTLETLPGGSLQNNEVAEGFIQSKAPLVVRDFNDLPELGRFVLVRGQDVVAGGIITLE